MANFGWSVERNKRDRRDCLEVGMAAQDIFADILMLAGYKIRIALTQEDIREHWDIEARAGGRLVKFDVKARKRLSRWNEQQDDFVWVELRGVNRGNLGWLYGGKADYIAFERAGDFVVISRKQLIGLVDKLVNPTKIVTKPHEALYSIYRRAGREDKVTLLKMTDILSADGVKVMRKPATPEGGAK